LQISKIKPGLKAGIKTRNPSPEFFRLLVHSMVRLILFLLVFVVFYYVFIYLVRKVFFLNNKTTQKSKPEELVQDPSCHMYIPQRSAVRKKIAGRVYYFCSKECLRKFLKL
jgi:YHS domain-containing protein